MSVIDKLRNKYFDSDASAAVDDVLSAVILLHISFIYCNERSAIDTLQNSNNPIGKTIQINWTQTLTILGIIICIIRLGLHRMMKQTPLLELTFSILAWTFFLIIIIVTAGNLIKLNDAIAITPATTPDSNTNNASQLDLLKLAQRQFQDVLNWAIISFVAITIYTIIRIVF